MKGRGTWLFLGFVLAGTAVLIALGTWQWNRRAEKRAFIAALEAAIASEPRTLAGAGLWERVELTGEFLPGRDAFIRTSRAAPKPGERDSRGRVPVSGFGVHVVSAFQAEICRGANCTSEIVLVSRGFLPTPPDGRIPAFVTPPGRVQLTGFLRPSEREGLFPPSNDPAKGVFFFRSTDQIARHLGLPNAGTPETALYHYPTFIDRQATPDETAPPFGIEARDFLKAVPNNHLEYAITWWSLAATNLVVALFFLIARRRQRGAKPDRENAVQEIPMTDRK